MKLLLNKIAHRLLTCFSGRPRLLLNAHLDRWLGYVDAEVLHLPAAMTPDKLGLALDIGANYGIMSYFLARRFKEVIAIEANPSLASALLESVPDNVRVLSTALSDHVGYGNLKVPVDRGVTLVGWGSLEPPSLHQLDRVNELNVKVTTLDALEIPQVDFIKIDVERHELALLRGSVLTLMRCKPWITVEVFPECRAEVLTFMQLQNYQSVDLMALTGHAGTSENMVFIPVGDLPTLGL
jgi:FkbM family methyltransferase